MRDRWTVDTIEAKAIAAQFGFTGKEGAALARCTTNDALGLAFAAAMGAKRARDRARDLRTLYWGVKRLATGRYRIERVRWGFYRSRRLAEREKRACERLEPRAQFALIRARYVDGVFEYWSPS